jgi:chromosome segregation ATPase
LEENVDTLKKQVDVDKGKLRACKSQLGLREEELNECKAELDNLRKKCEKSLEGKKEVEEQNAQLKLYIAKLEESSTKLQKVVQKKEDALKKSNYTVDSLNSVSCQDSGFEGFFDVFVSIRRKSTSWSRT